MLRTKRSVPGVDACHSIVSLRITTRCFLSFLLVLIYLPESACTGAHRGKDRLVRRLLQQIARGLVQRYYAKDIDLKMLLELGSLDVLYQRVALHDGGVGDDDVETVDAVLRLELLDDVEGILLDRSVVFDHDQTATLGLWQVGKRLGG